MFFMFFICKLMFLNIYGIINQMSKIYTILVRKIFSRFWGDTLPPSPIAYAYDQNSLLITFVLFHSLTCTISKVKVKRFLTKRKHG